MPVTTAGTWAEYRQLQRSRQSVGRRGRLPSPPSGPDVPVLAVLAPSRTERLALADAGAGMFTAVDISAGDGSRVIAPAPGLVGGWTVRETTGTASAAAVLRDGSGATAVPLAEIAVASGGAEAGTCPVPGVLVFNGLYLEVLSGTWEGSVYYMPLEVTAT